MKKQLDIPSLLMCCDGQLVKTTEVWETKRRPELLELFREHEYGYLPSMEDVEVHTKITDSSVGEHIMDGRAIRNTVEIELARKGIHFSFTFVVFIPLSNARPVPAFVTICNRGIKDSDPARHFLSSFWPAETLVERGYACAIFRTQEVAPDYEENFTTAFYRLFPEYVNNRPANAWGAIATWAWAASRVMDYFEEESLIDHNKVAVVGHSRGGKAALWCAAQDKRFHMVVSSGAGNSGDALSRGIKGETIKDITSRFPYWFCKNYQNYINNEESLPFDQHMLLALVAPRLLYTSSRTFDIWADPEGQFKSCVLASPAYELYGVNGITTNTFPKPESPLHEGYIGHHRKTGPHDMDEYDWEQYIKFADLHFK